MSERHHSSKKRQKKSIRKKKGAGKMFSGFIFAALALFRSSIDAVIDYIFSWFFDDSEQKRLPGIKNKLLTESAVSLADKIRNKEVTSEAIVKLFIERIKEINPIINGLVDDRFEAAIEEACAADKLISISADSLNELKISKPFLGVPFTSKESSSAKGLNFSFGLVSRKNVKATEDADIVEKVKASGAILLGVSNVPELNLWCETRNNVYGQTNNPFNVNRTVGGSTGGEASLITSCGSPLGLGTDIGGSARMPAYYCGIYGHKPTTGLTSSRGMTFRKGTEKDTMVTAGTMTRYAKDIVPLLKLLVGPSNVQKLNLDSEVDISKLDILFVEEPRDIRLSPISGVVKAAVRRAVGHLSDVTDNEPREISLPGFRHSYNLWRHAMTKEEGKFSYDLSNRQGEVSLWTEVPRLLTGRSSFTLPCIMRLVDLYLLPQVNKKWAEKETSKLQTQLLEELGENGILIFPSCPTTAPMHYASFFRMYNWAYWAIFNVLKLPVTQCPLGLDSSGLPVGIQIVGPPYKDHLTIAVACELERAFGGWVSPSAISE